MLRLLLDEQISPDVAAGLRRKHKDVKAVALAEWEGGRFLGQPDEAVLTGAATQGLTLVTYDRKTIPPLLKIWSEAERDFGGVVFVDEKTIRPSDLGGLIHALQRLHSDTVSWDWSNRVYFLRR